MSESSLNQALIISTAIKLLLIPSYRSTDFEVHRNWLAVTHSLPIGRWYFEDTSQWTLDYPPFFAYWEWILSQIAQFVDPEMLKVSNLGYASDQTVWFQRGTVMLSELLLFFAVQKVSRSVRVPSATLVALSIWLSPGFLIVDHMHFQYNGAMYGLLIFSMLYAEDKPILAAFLFSTLLCFKHIYLYLAPAYFVYLLRRVVITSSLRGVNISGTIKLGLAVLLPLALAFLPFMYMRQMPQVISRLFPFNRGLCHAYWAPNFWALYSFVDRVAIRLSPRLGLKLDPKALTSVTRGLVGDTQFAWLPEVKPETTFSVTLALQILAMTKLFLRPSYENFLGSLTLCGYASFFFGWHVHEKAVLLVIIPASFLAMKNTRYFSAFRPLIQGGYTGLLPLIFTPAEIPVALSYTLIYLLTVIQVFSSQAPVPRTERIFLLDRCQQLYTLTFVPLMAFNYVIHPLFFGDNESFEFLPQMLISTYCAWGIFWSGLGLNYLFFSSS